MQILSALKAEKLVAEIFANQFFRFFCTQERFLRDMFREKLFLQRKSGAVKSRSLYIIRIQQQKLNSIDLFKKHESHKNQGFQRERTVFLAVRAVLLVYRSLTDDAKEKKNGE